MNVFISRVNFPVTVGGVLFPNDQAIEEKTIQAVAEFTVKRA